MDDTKIKRNDGGLFFQLRYLGKCENRERREKNQRPVTSDQYNEITQKLEKYGIDVYGVGADTFTYNALLDKNTLTEDMLQVPKFSDDSGETRTEIVSVDNELYKKLCDRAGAEYGSILLLNTYQYNDNGEYVSIKPFKDDVTQISLINAANEKNTLTIGGILEQSDLKEYGFWEMTPYPVRIVVPDADARSFDWLVCHQMKLIIQNMPEVSWMNIFRLWQRILM